jgi:hypothetical protein
VVQVRTCYVADGSTSHLTTWVFASFAHAISRHAGTFTSTYLYYRHLTVIRDHEITAERGMSFALRHRNRVGCIPLFMPVPNLQKLIIMARTETGFSILECTSLFLTVMLRGNCCRFRSRHTSHFQTFAGSHGGVGACVNVLLPWMAAVLESHIGISSSCSL